MKKQIFALVLSVLLILTGAIAIGFWFKKKSDTSSEKVVTPVVEETYSANISPNTKPKTNQLEVQGVNTESQKPTNQLPTPSEFSTYEQYADDKTALYIDTLPGTGAEATNGSTVAMLYQGWLTNGQLFDQSRKNEQGQIEPFVFQLGSGQVIPGWDQAITGMKEGGKRRLVVPASTGYGPNAQGSIPANSMLIFDVELIAVQK